MKKKKKESEESLIDNKRDKATEVLDDTITDISNQQIAEDFNFPLATSTPDKKSSKSYRALSPLIDGYSSDDQEQQIDITTVTTATESINSLSLDESSISGILSKLRLDDKKQFIETHLDDSSDEEKIEKPKKYLNSGWKAFSKPNVYPLTPYTIINQKIIPLERQLESTKYKLKVTLDRKEESWKDVDPNKDLYLESSKKQQYLLYPHIFNLLIKNNYSADKKVESTQIQYSFLLHQAAIELLYGQEVADKYYLEKEKLLSFRGKEDAIKEKIIKAILDAIRNLCLSLYVSPYDFEKMSSKSKEVCTDHNLQKEVKSLAEKIIEKRAFGYRYRELINEVFPVQAKNCFFAALKHAISTQYELAEDEDSVSHFFDSVIKFCLNKLNQICTQNKNTPTPILGKSGIDFHAPAQKIREKSYETLFYAHNKQFTDRKQEFSRLCKVAWEYIQGMETGQNLTEELKNYQAELFHNFIQDLEGGSTNKKIIEEINNLKNHIKYIDKKNFMNHIDSFMGYSIEKINIDRPTLNDSSDFINTSFVDILANIRLANRSQTRKIRNFITEEGKKIHGETFIRSWGFGKKPGKFAIETQEITTNLARNDLIKNVGSYAKINEDIIKLKVELQLEDHNIADLMWQLLQGRSVGLLQRSNGTSLITQEVHRKILVNIVALMFITETARNPASVIANLMILDLIEAEKLTWKDALNCYKRKVPKKEKEVEVEDGGVCPMSMDEAVSSARFLHRIYIKYKYHGEENNDIERIVTLIEREAYIVEQWLALQKKPTHDPVSSEIQVEEDKVAADFFNAIAPVKRDSWYKSLYS